MNYNLGFWNPKQLLPYQRHFNFVNSVRKTGKTYSLGAFFIERFLQYGEESILITRTQDEKKNGALKNWFSKVLKKEFPDLTVSFTSNTMYLCPTKYKNDWIVMGHCRALTEVIKMKKETSFWNTRWAAFDEYMLEPKYFDMYVKGWKEPDLLLNIYDTIDRGEDRLIMFLLGNNTSFYNPYHMHPAFNIPPTQPGQIWKGKNVLFQMFEPSEEFKQKYLKSDFSDMVANTDYGDYANQGIYSDDESFIAERKGKYTYSFSIANEDLCFGIWCGGKGKPIIISDDFNPGIMIFRTDGKAVEGHYILSKDSYIRKFIVLNYGKNNIFYESMEIKAKAEPVIKKLLGF